jgi:hypothetical protein
VKPVGTGEGERNERFFRSPLLEMPTEAKACIHPRWENILLIVLQEDSGDEKSGSAGETEKLRR